jgi:hypothetical protein
MTLGRAKIFGVAWRCSSTIPSIICEREEEHIIQMGTVVLVLGS